MVTSRDTFFICIGIFLGMLFILGIGIAAQFLAAKESCLSLLYSEARIMAEAHFYTITP